MNKKGFTLNMAHYVQRATVDGEYLITGKDTYLRIFIHSNYALGFVFGSFLAIGNASLVTYKHSKRGSVRWYIPVDKIEYFGKLQGYMKESFALDLSLRRSSKGVYQAICYSKPLAELLSEFGKGEDKHLPDKYLVNNAEFLEGIKEGIKTFEGHKLDTRPILNTRKFSSEVAQLYERI